MIRANSSYRRMVRHDNIREMLKNSPIYACSIPVTCLDHFSFIPLVALHDHTKDQIDSTNRPSYVFC